ncbi:MAG: TonB-dependent receptor, partial [Rhodospirillaceae bacterium]|nr:TonB-dependent receptor [Rhodospirillaceae bacterium]
SEFQYAAEKLWVYELGAKTEWLDNRLIANAAFFYQDYTDKQVATLIPVPNTDFNTARIINAGQARVKGMELETVAQATENLRLSASYTYLNAKYTKFDYLTASSNEVIRNGNCEVVRSNGVAICSTSLTGRRLEGAPRHALVMSANYTASAATLLGDDAEWFIEGDSRYQSRRFIEASNNRTLSSYWLLNARVGVTRDQWEVLFYVDNVTDNRTVKSALRDSGTVEQARFNTAAPPDTLLVNLPDPRTVGIRAKVNF